MSRRPDLRPGILSAKGARTLRDLGLEKFLAGPEKFVVVGPEFAMRKSGEVMRLAFSREGKEISVGLAVPDGDDWKMSECEPFTMRTFGYYRRKLRRSGEWIDPNEPDVPDSDD